MFPAISELHHLPYQNFNQAPLLNKAGYTATPVPCGGGGGGGAGAVFEVIWLFGQEQWG